MLPKIVLAALALARAAARPTAPPRFSDVSPADAEAPEGALPPAAPVLTAEPAATPGPTPTPTATPAHHHHGGQP
jgi:hypothetical protein